MGPVEQNILAEPLLHDAPRVTVQGRTYPVLGGIRLLRRLGQGGMATVFCGFHPRLEVEVAVKVMALHLAAESPLMVQRFVREAQIAAQVQSPHLVHMQDVNEEAGLYYIVMEYVHGLSALKYLESAKSTGAVGIPEADALAIATAACEGLRAAHTASIVHRDIKPDNIMIPFRGRRSKELDFPRAKVMDLGLARHISRGGESKSGSLTLTNVTMGTPGYMAPEQIMDARQANARSDVFSMGATIYALLAGRSPFKRKTGMQTVMATMASVHEPLNKVRPDISLYLVNVVENCLGKDPAQRYADAGELLADLKKIPRLLAEDRGTRSTLHMALPGQARAAPAASQGRAAAAPAQAKAASSSAQARAVSAPAPATAPASSAQARAVTTPVQAKALTAPPAQQRLFKLLLKIGPMKVVVALGLLLALGGGAAFVWSVSKDNQDYLRSLLAPVETALANGKLDEAAETKLQLAQDFAARRRLASSDPRLQACRSKAFDYYHDEFERGLARRDPAASQVIIDKKLKPLLPGDARIAACENKLVAEKAFRQLSADITPLPGKAHREALDAALGGVLREMKTKLEEAKSTHANDTRLTMLQKDFAEASTAFAKRCGDDADKLFKPPGADFNRTKQLLAWAIEFDPENAEIEALRKKVVWAEDQGTARSHIAEERLDEALSLIDKHRSTWGRSNDFRALEGAYTDKKSMAAAYNNTIGTAGKAEKAGDALAPFDDGKPKNYDEAAQAYAAAKSLDWERRVPQGKRQADAGVARMATKKGEVLAARHVECERLLREADTVLKNGDGLKKAEDSIKEAERLEAANTGIAASSQRLKKARDDFDEAITQTEKYLQEPNGEMAEKTLNKARSLDRVNPKLDDLGKRLLELTQTDAEQREFREQLADFDRRFPTERNLPDLAEALNKAKPKFQNDAKVSTRKEKLKAFADFEEDLDKTLEAAGTRAKPADAKADLQGAQALLDGITTQYPGEKRAALSESKLASAKRAVAARCGSAAEEIIKKNGGDLGEALKLLDQAIELNPDERRFKAQRSDVVWRQDALAARDHLENEELDAALQLIEQHKPEREKDPQYVALLQAYNEQKAIRESYDGLMRKGAALEADADKLDNLADGKLVQYNAARSDYANAKAVKWEKHVPPETRRAARKEAEIQAKIAAVVTIRHGASDKALDDADDQLTKGYLGQAGTAIARAGELWEDNPRIAGLRAKRDTQEKEYKAAIASATEHIGKQQWPEASADVDKAAPHNREGDDVARLRRVIADGDKESARTLAREHLNKGRAGLANAIKQLDPHKADKDIAVILGQLQTVRKTDEQIELQDLLDADKKIADLEALEGVANSAGMPALKKAKEELAGLVSQAVKKLGASNFADAASVASLDKERQATMAEIGRLLGEARTNARYAKLMKNGGSFEAAGDAVTEANEKIKQYNLALNEYAAATKLKAGGPADTKTDAIRGKIKALNEAAAAAHAERERRRTEVLANIDGHLANDRLNDAATMLDAADVPYPNDANLKARRVQLEDRKQKLAEYDGHITKGRDFEKAGDAATDDREKLSNYRSALGEFAAATSLKPSGPANALADVLKPRATTLAVRTVEDLINKRDRKAAQDKLNEVASLLDTGTKGELQKKIGAIGQSGGGNPSTDSTGVREGDTPKPPPPTRTPRRDTDPTRE